MDTTPSSAPRRGLRTAAVWVAVAATVGVALTATFWAYLNPHLALELANLAWACF